MIVAQSCLTLYNPMDCSLPCKNTRVGHYSLLQGIFLTQGSNLGFPALQADSSPSEPPRKPLVILRSLLVPISEPLLSLLPLTAFFLLIRNHIASTLVQDFLLHSHNCIMKKIVVPGVNIILYKWRHVLSLVNKLQKSPS